MERWLLRHAWPGNVRELENALERGVVLARGERIEFDDLLVDPEAEDQPSTADGAGLRGFLDAAAAERIRAVLAEVGGSRWPPRVASASTGPPSTA